MNKTMMKSHTINANTDKNTPPNCPYKGRCGGCSFMGMSYEKQLEQKQKKVEKLLKGFGQVMPIRGMENPFYYRNKVHRVAEYNRKKGAYSGMYREETHQVIHVEDCLIEDQKSQQIIETVFSLLPSFKVRVYDEDTGYGLLRHVMVRRGFTSGEIMLILVASSPVFPSKNNFVKAVRKVHPEITTIVLNVNTKDTTMVLGERNIVLYGPGFIYDTLGGLRFRISAGSFYQVNPVQTEVLYREAVEAARLTGKESVLDAYCGIGTIGLLASRQAGKVTGVELNKEAVKDAGLNARANKIDNARFLQGDAGEFMQEMAARGEKADVVFMDPPRSGSNEAFLSSLVSMGPARVVYISCNPETQARDLKYLTAKGYRAKYIRPVDMFAWCDHVESVCLLSNRKPDTKVRIDVDLEDYYRIKDAKKNQN